MEIKNIMSPSRIHYCDKITRLEMLDQEHILEGSEGYPQD